MTSLAQKTIFVVGAGASKEVNLPIGSELKKEIAEVLKWSNKSDYFANDNIINHALKTKHEKEPLFKACEIIRRAMPQAISIDNFLDVHSDNEEIIYSGKLAIIRTILAAESNSKLIPGKYEGIFQIRHNEIEETWFNMFFQQLTEGCNRENLKKRMKSVVFIIFNYDRCIEHFLYYAFQNYYAINSSETTEILQNIEFYHPYGTVGSLPWQNKDITIEYGATPTGKQLSELTPQIKTFTEGVDETRSEISTIRSYMANFERLIFLGFAFHKINMEFLLPMGIRARASHSKKIYATGIAISPHDKKHIISDLRNRFGIQSDQNIEMYRHSCYELLQQYKRGLSFT